MTRRTIIVTLILAVMMLGVRIRGLLLLAAGALVLGGLVFSLRCYRQARPVFGALVWTMVLSCVLLVLSVFVPNIRLWQLLYL